MCIGKDQVNHSLHVIIARYSYHCKIMRKKKSNVVFPVCAFISTEILKVHHRANAVEKKSC